MVGDIQNIELLTHSTRLSSNSDTTISHFMVCSVSCQNFSLRSTVLSVISLKFTLSHMFILPHVTILSLSHYPYKNNSASENWWYRITIIL